MISEYAKLVMENRQLGAPLSLMMDAATDSNNEKERRVLEKMTIEAYETPKYSSKEMINEEVNEFQNKYYLNCFKAMRADDSQDK